MVAETLLYIDSPQKGVVKMSTHKHSHTFVPLIGLAGSINNEFAVMIN